MILLLQLSTISNTIVVANVAIVVTIDIAIAYGPIDIASVVIVIASVRTAIFILESKCCCCY